MAFDAGLAGGRSSPRWSGTIGLSLAALIVSLGAAAWISSPDQTALALAALPETTDRSSFEARFFPIRSHTESAGLQPADRFTFSFMEIEVRTAKSLLAQRLRSGSWRGDLFDDARIDIGRVDEARPPRVGLIPLPRSRPAAADIDVRSAPALAQAVRPDDRTLLQKLSDLLPGRVTLASLAPNGGLFRQGPDLASLGFDNLTAVYDISAHAVYLPSGLSLEAHSGMGSLKDDPEHVSVPNAGATPPAVYDLKPREKPFHGVEALRMIPVEGSDISGRSGLLVHSFMLGPNGDSNGCVSVKNYDRFLKAFNDGEVNRLVVVPSLRKTILASQRAT